MSILLENSFLVIVFTLGILIFIHELGHFLVGRWLGMSVASFSIGFGPALLSFKRNGTCYRLGLIPLGGYVQFVGAHPKDPVPEPFIGGEIFRQPVWRRAAMTLAGPVANLFLAMVAFGLIAYLGVLHPSSTVGQVEEDSPAWKAGLRSGDVITSIEGESVELWSDLVSWVKDSGGRELAMEVSRGEEILNVQAVPRQTEQGGKLGIISAFLPAVVRVLVESPAHKQEGFPQVIRIVSVGLEGGEPVEVSTYEELRRALGELAHSLEKLTLSFTYHRSLVGEEEEVQQVLFEVSLPAHLKKDLQQVELGDHLLKAVGFASSPMMIIKEYRSQDSSELEEPEIVLGDIVKSVEGHSVDSYFDFLRVMNSLDRSSPQYTIEVLRGDQLIETKVEGVVQREQTQEGAKSVYGFPLVMVVHALEPAASILKKEGLWGSVVVGVKGAWEGTVGIAQSLWGLVVGKVPLKALGGPIIISHVAQKAASKGLSEYLKILALISLNLFLLNLMPIPVLDGGQLVLLGIEKIKGSRPSVSFMEGYQTVGVVMVLSLVLLTTYNDLSRFWVGILQSLGLGV